MLVTEALPLHMKLVKQQICAWLTVELKTVQYSVREGMIVV